MITENYELESNCGDSVIIVTNSECSSRTATPTAFLNSPPDADVIWNQKSRPRLLITAKFITNIEDGRTFIIGHDFGLDIYRRTGDCEFLRVATRNEEFFRELDSVYEVPQAGCFGTCDVKNCSITIYNYNTGERVAEFRKNSFEHPSYIEQWKEVIFTGDYALVTGYDSFFGSRNNSALVEEGKVMNFGFVPLSRLSNSTLALIAKADEDGPIKPTRFFKAGIKTSRTGLVVGSFNSYYYERNAIQFDNERWSVGIVNIATTELKKLTLCDCETCYKHRQQKCVEKFVFDRTGRFVIGELANAMTVYDSATGELLHHLKNFQSTSLSARFDPTLMEIQATANGKYLCISSQPIGERPDLYKTSHARLIYKLPPRTVSKPKDDDEDDLSKRRDFTRHLGTMLPIHSLIHIPFVSSNILTSTTVEISGRHWLQLFRPEGQIVCAPMDECGYIQIRQFK